MTGTLSCHRSSLSLSRDTENKVPVRSRSRSRLGMLYIFFVSITLQHFPLCMILGYFHLHSLCRHPCTYDLVGDGRISSSPVIASGPKLTDERAKIRKHLG